MELTPALTALVADEWANYESMCREAVTKGRPGDVPPEPTLGSLADSVEQMPDDILEGITSTGPDDVREQLVDLLAEYGREELLPELD